MEVEFEQPHVILRNRTPRNKEVDAAVRESLLSDSTSGIGKGEEDDLTSVGSSSFSSPDLDVSKRERASTVVSKDDLNHQNGKDKGRKLEFEIKSKDIEISITENSIDENSKLLKQSIENDTSVASDHYEIKPKVKIPDGDWGWVVVLSSFIISMIADGISFSFGLLYIEFLEEFGASKATTAWIGSLFIAVPLISGPVMSALVDRYGCRSMTILGGIISTIGFILASISTTLEMMMITFGVISGLGLGLVYVTAVVSIAYWFEKKRNLAVGLGACGTGVGTFVYAPMTQYFIEEYGWRGTILLLSGTLLNLCVCGCVMRDPEWWILEQKRQRDKDEEKSERDKKSKGKLKSKSSNLISMHAYVDVKAPTHGKRMKGLIQQGFSPEEVIKFEAVQATRKQNLLQYMQNRNRVIQKTESMHNIPTYLTYTDERSMGTLDLLIRWTLLNYERQEVTYPKFTLQRSSKQNPIYKDECISPPAVNFPDFPLKRTNSCDGMEYSVKKERWYYENGYQLKDPRQSIYRETKPEESKKMVKQDSKENKRDWLKKQLSVNHHYLKDLKMPINSIGHRNAMLNTKRYRLKASSCPDIFKNSMITINEKEEKWYADCVSCLADMFNVSLFKKMTFNLMCLGTIILFIWFIVPYFYLAEYMVDNGFSEDDGAVMLSLIGITNTIGMVGLGWIGDFPQVSIGNLYAACLVLCGATVATIPFAVSNFWFLSSICSAFGLLFAASFTFTPSLLVTLVSLDDFTTAYGLVLLAQGIGHLIGPPLSGLMYDLTSSWELSFYLAGGWIVVSGVLISFIQPIRTYQQRRMDEEEKRSNYSVA